jgi:hypothetical protein
MAGPVQQMYPVAPFPVILGVVRRLEVATVLDQLSPPHPAHGLSGGRGVKAWVLAILDGDHALDTVGKRLAERGMLEWLQPGFTRARCLLTAWGTFSKPCLPPISIAS